MSRRDGLPDSLAKRIALALAAADAVPTGVRLADAEPHYVNPAPLYRTAAARLRALVRSLDEAAVRWERERALTDTMGDATTVRNKHPRARPAD